MEQRTLSAAYKFYCKKELDNAHTAAADTEATYEILKAQLDTYSDNLPNDIKQLSEFTTRSQIADFAGFIAYNDKEEEIFTFGKHKGRKAPQYPVGYPLSLLGSFRLGVGSVQESLLHSLRVIDVSHIDH